MVLGRVICSAVLVVGLAGAAMRAQGAPPIASPTATDEKPLPELHPLIMDLDKNQKAAEAAAENYTYHLHRTIETLDGTGNVKKTETLDMESLTIDGVRVDRTVARNGKPLTPEEAKKEDERIDKEVAKARERRAKADAKDRATDSRGDQLITASRFFELGTFSNERREEFNGRPTILVDYAGDPNAKTKNPAEKAVRDLVGTVWIDEADRTMTRADGHFLNDFKIGGGLVLDIRKGTHFSMSEQKVNGEAWLLDRIDADGHLRALLFVGFTGHFHLAATDYRKFHTTSSIVGTNGVIGADGKPVVEPPPEPQPATPKP
ncbi:MAG TPA: hypothetical protein VFC39_16660 [Acidobacteriaceae bacterium]|nr:hypothetical protein [Acidobacteriaceae bacterium]